MSETRTLSRGVQLLVIAASLVIISGAINQAQSVLVPFLFASFLAMLGTPPVLWLERRGLPSVVAVLIAVTGVVAVLLVAGGWAQRSRTSSSSCSP
ncbi:MAG TPA: AI-2E family transporter [Anaeromyxobacteraceae bacterium]|nr:AI-2E family transporter [Anaeromyxobacteraceae bacterium]